MQKKQYNVELSDEAEKDFKEAYEYYANQSKKVADNFYKNLDNSLAKIAHNPTIYTKAHKDISKLVMKKFPFVIYFRVKNVLIRVIAIFNTSRDPQIWKERN